MARKYIGLPFGAMIALCAILLLAPDSRGQNITKKKYTISGSVGLANVNLSGFPTPTKTDDTGAYSVQVEHGWNGTVTPTLKGYTFEPRTRTIPKVVAPVSTMDFTPKLVTFTISGSVMQADVKMAGFPGPEEVVSDAKGRYTATVPMGWTGTVTPTKTAYQFEPVKKTYADVSKAMPAEDYKASDQMIVISGTAGVPGVVMKGLPGDPVAGPKGNYTTKVKYGQSLKVTPTLEGYEFIPPEKEYQVLTENQTNQDFAAKQFVYQISGSAGMAGVAMKGLPGDTVLTNEDGLYTATVPHGWSGTVTPDKPGHIFTPKSIAFSKVTAVKESQDFAAQIIQYTIAGNAGVPGATMSGLPGEPVSDEKTGAYKAQVDYGWTGVVTPKKEGVNFTPASKEYANAVTQNQTQDYKAVPILFKISGNVGQAQAVVKISPGTASVVSGPNGDYSLEVPFNWKGTIAPQKAGFTFDPNSRPYGDGVLSPQVGQDFAPKIMQCVLVGHIADETGKDVADVMVLSEPDAGSTTTDATGKFEIKVPYGWKGKLTFQKEGHNFTPPSKLFDAVLQSTTNVTVSAKIKMWIIRDRLMAGPDPIAEVKITASPGNIAPVMSDLKGEYKVQVPHGWTGELKFEKDGLDFDPPTKPFTNVTDDMDAISPKKAVTPSPQTPSPATGAKPATPAQAAQPAATSPAATTPTSTGPGAGATPPPAVSAKEQQILQQLNLANEELNTVRTQMDGLRQKGGQPTAPMTQRQNDLQTTISKLMIQLNQVRQGGAATSDGAGGLTTRQPGDTLPLPGPGGAGPRVPAMTGPTLLNVLSELAKKTGVTITPDATVKPDVVNLDLSRLENLPVPSALQLLVNSTPQPYMFRGLDDRTYEVFRPISNMFQGSRLEQALRDVATTAEFPIVVDPNVSGDVNVAFDNVPLEEALQLMLAGKPYVFKKTPRYYLVASRNITSQSFMDISETHRVRLNYVQPARAKSLLSPIFAPYVQAEQPNPRDPNDQGNMLLITAAPAIASRIIEDIKQIDRYRRQVLLDARVVVMEKGNLLNLGVEWGWPTMKAGLFTDRVPDATTGNVSGGWPYGVQMGYAPDKTFTNSLMAALNLLEQNSQADIIAKPQVVSQDGHQAEMRVVQEQWFMMQATQSTQFYTQAQLQKIESGTVLTITPYIGDNNDITLQLAVEVSDSIPRARGSDLPLVTRRMAKNSVVVKDGGTVAVGGLTENRSRSEEKRVPILSSIPGLGELFKNKSNDKASREVAVFVTAHLVPEGTQVAGRTTSEPGAIVTNEQPAGDEFRQSLNEALTRQSK
jgi:type II secretory pathway component GspD/PulD (secretin)